MVLYLWMQFLCIYIKAAIVSGDGIRLNLWPVRDSPEKRLWPPPPPHLGRSDHRIKQPSSPSCIMRDLFVRVWVCSLSRYVCVCVCVFTLLTWTLIQSAAVITQISGHETSVCSTDLCECVCVCTICSCEHVHIWVCNYTSTQACTSVTYHPMCVLCMYCTCSLNSEQISCESVLMSLQDWWCNSVEFRGYNTNKRCKIKTWSYLHFSLNMENPEVSAKYKKKSNCLPIPLSQPVVVNKGKTGFQ